MNLLVAIVGGAIGGTIAGFIIGYFVGKGEFEKTDAKQTEETEFFINPADKEKSENLAKLKEHVKTLSDGQVNNKKVRDFLGVSDATACRYLDDLEKENFVKQVGHDGPNVYYERQ